MKDRKLTAPEMGRLTVEEYRSRGGNGIAVVLDNVRSAYNIGSAFRSADAFAADKLVLCGICATPPSAEIHKTALGAEESVPWEHYADTLEAVASLKAEGYTIVSVEQTENSVKLQAGGVLPSETASLRSAPPFAERKVALIFGNEVEGVQQSVVDASDFCLEIPQHGTKHSLNVAVTVGIVLWAFGSGRQKA